MKVTRKLSSLTARFVVAATLLGTGALVGVDGQQSKTNRRPAPVAAKQTSKAPAATPTPAPAKANRRDEALTTRDATPAATNAPASLSLPGTVKTNAADAVVYSYEFTQPAFTVRHILIDHDAAGRGHVSFARKNENEDLTEPLQIAPAALARINAAWDALHFLDTDASYQADKQFPHLGTLRLRQKQGGRERTAEFNWTNDPNARALADEYRRLADQQLFVFDITLARQYQPSEAVTLLKGLDILLDRKGLSDPAQLAPLLRDLTTDERISLIARTHAARILKKIEK